MQGQYRPVRAGFSCAAVRCGVHVAKHASRHECGLAFGHYLNRDAGILSEGVGARPVPARACRRVLASFGRNKGVSCAAVRCGVHVLSTHRDMVAD